MLQTAGRLPLQSPLSQTLRFKVLARVRVALAVCFHSKSRMMSDW